MSNTGGSQYTSTLVTARRPGTSTSTSSKYASMLHTPRPTTQGSIVGVSRKRPRTAASTVAAHEHHVVCALSESRGISPTVGLAFVNLSTTEAVLCQISDNQTYTKTEQKLLTYRPSEILCMNTATHPKSNLYQLVETNLREFPIHVIDRKYWEEMKGMDYIERFAFRDELEALRVCLEGHYFAICCFAAALQYIELGLSVSFPFHSLRVRFEPSQDTMMIDRQTCRSLELIQNLQRANSKDCLYGLINHTITPMGGRRLRISVMQPSTDRDLLLNRYAAVEELSTREEIFFSVRKALKSFSIDVDKVLTLINTVPKIASPQHTEQAINNVIMLKQYIKSLPALREALAPAENALLKQVSQITSDCALAGIEDLIDTTINEDTTYQTQPLDLRNQRTYAVKAGVNGLLDVARTTYKEGNNDAVKHINDLGNDLEIALDVKWEAARGYYIRIPTTELEERPLPAVFINCFRKKNFVECQTLDLVKWNQKIRDSHDEVLQMSDQSIRQLIDDIREDISPLFKVSDAIALLDMLVCFAHLVTTQDYVRPDLGAVVAVKDGRHPIIEKIRHEKFIPNDTYAAPQSRFQIITGCNMSGKSTHIRSLALMSVMAQIGSFIPASHASLPIFHQLLARISVDDSALANTSSFSVEMREMAFILHNITPQSMVIIDELGRGTATRDGLCIAIAIAETLVDSKAFVWFITHFRELPQILKERNGVVNLHLAVDLQPEQNRMTMLYRMVDGACEDENYGLQLAKVVNLPSDVIKTAEKVSKQLRENAAAKKQGSKTIAIAKRRKLILNLREQLLLARDGKMEGRALKIWLKKLQDEFVKRMIATEEDMKAAGYDSDDPDFHGTSSKVSESVNNEDSRPATAASSLVSDLASRANQQEMAEQL